MFNQNRVYRLFQLIVFLKTRPPKTINSIADFLSTSERTTYRYLDLLKEIGFSLEKDKNGRYAITNSDTQIPLTVSEIDFLKKLLTSSKSNKLAKGILQKIGTHDEANANAESIYNAHLSKIIELISIALAENKQVKIKSYFSANSETISDRVVEPVCFTDNYQSLAAYEISSKQNKYFNLERIGDVDILPHPIKFQKHHEYHKPDVFGFQGKDLDKEIEMELSPRAYLILRDDYPMCMPYLQKLEKNGKYLLRVKVQSFLAPARFVKGLQGEIEVIGAKAFLSYLKRSAKSI